MLVGGEEGGRWIGGMERQLRALAMSPFIRQELRMLVAKENYEDLQVVKELIEAGKIRPVVDRTYSLSQTPEAIRYMEEGAARAERWSSRCPRVEKPSLARAGLDDAEDVSLRIV